MTKQEIINAIKQGGFIHKSEYQKPTLHDSNGSKIAIIPGATMESIARGDGMAKWQADWGGVYVACRSGRKYSEHENYSYCKHIANDLENHIDGRVYKCPECGETHTTPENVEKYCCDRCGFVGDLDEWEQCNLYDYLLESGLDIEYRIGSDREYRSAEIMVAWGGPNIYIDTAKNAVLLYWGGEQAQYNISGATADEIDNVCEEQYNSL